MGPFLAPCKYNDFCDKMAIVQVVGSSKTKDLFLAACIRNIWPTSASCDIHIDIKHIPGKKECNCRPAIKIAFQ